MREWVVAQAPSETCTTHWWANELPTPQRAAFEAVADGVEMKQMFFDRFGASQYACESLPGMNEVYVASLVHANNSDTVFFMDHVDGPYMLYPFCYVYRTLVAITTNTQISTVFPMQPFKVAISDGEVIGLDFHREVHRIESDASKPNTERRITCKVRVPPPPRARLPRRAAASGPDDRAARRAAARLTRRLERRLARDSRARSASRRCTTWSTPSASAPSAATSAR
jgi:hypothetical protein